MVKMAEVRDRIIAEVAEELGITKDAVERVVRSQFNLVRHMIVEKDRSVYLRPIGMFLSMKVKNDLGRDRYNFRIKKLDNVKPAEEPLEFD